ncbi:uncharacterized protein LOC133176350 [Saccostrea echinata]|uniref:uncharacterized protein LOC133176350 n=1 Tax=Saccostrea echinata TaxID=191078 RepID=UPI002A7F8B48|nr:uncharacterized protein LOC133176350 [Saccostrea echinata]
MHKHRPFVKPMMVVTTSGYVVSVLGPYLADSKNNNAGILNHMIRNNTEEMRDWLQDGDTFIVDRGFRDSSEMLGDIGINMEMPCFMQRGTSQHTTQEASHLRLITKVRWVVESANARLKRWKYLNHVIPNTQIPFIGDYIRIVGALCNRFTSALSSGNEEEDQATALKMLHLSKRKNELQEFVESNGSGLSNRTYSEQKIDAAGFAQDFPKLSDSEIHQLTLGVNQPVCDATFRITSICAKWPGSVHDSRIWRESALCQKFENGEYNGFLLGDSGYPCKRYLMTPFLNPSTVPKQKFNAALCKTRVIVEQTFGILKRRFSCLQGVLRTTPRQATKYIVACAILHNTGIDQGDIVESTQVQFYGGNNNYNNALTGDGFNMHNYIVDTYFTCVK